MEFFLEPNVLGGAFIDIGGVDGLVHVTELSWSRNAKPSDILKEGDEVQAQVLEVNKRKKQIKLSMKALQPEPEPNAEETEDGEHQHIHKAYLYLWYNYVEDYYSYDKINQNSTDTYDPNIANKVLIKS